MDTTAALIEQFTGFLLSEREENRRDDSYFHMTVWNPEESEPQHHLYAATAWPSTPLHPRTVQVMLDCTLPSVKTALQRFNEQQDRVAHVKLLLIQMQHGEVFVGDTVRVVRGRKVPKGTVGRVINVEKRVTHVSKYGTWETKESFALVVTPAGAWSVKAEYLEVVERGPVMQEIFDLAD